MKKIFRKAVTVLGSIALIGATAGFAAAASYPAPFTSNTAIVVGANAAPSDNIAAASIASNLDANAVTNTSTTTITTNGDSYKFEKSSTKFHLGDDITSIKSTLGSDEMPSLLADGTYTDSNNDDFDYTQSITMDSANLTMFNDNDYSRDDPTVGIKYSNNQPILTYTLDFTDEPDYADLPTTDLTIMGKDYYVLSAANSKLTLLDSAADSIVAEGDTATITAGGKTYTVSIEFVNSDTAKLNINGEITNSLSETDTYKLDDGSYVGIKDILYSSKDTGVSKVEFSIGSGKLVLENGQDVQMNEDTIDGLTATITNSTNGLALSEISLAWTASDRMFVTKDSVITMPGFDAVSLSFTGLDYPTVEPIEVSYDGDDSLILNNFPLKDSTEDINLLYKNSSDTEFGGIGRSYDELLLTGASNITFNTDVDSYFVASYDDGSNAESYLMRVTNVKTDNGIDKATFQYKKDGSWTDAKVDRKAGDDFSLGNVEIKVGEVNNSLNTVNFWADGADTNFDTLYSDKGFKIILPTTTSTDAGYINFSATTTNYTLQMVEENKDGDPGAGETINATVKANSGTDKVSVDSITGDVSAAEVGTSEIWRSFTYSPLATEILQDKSDSDQRSVTLNYHGDEVAAGVYITSPSAIGNSSGDAGVMTVKDSEVATVSGKNLIVVGGSAINSVAAELLGGAYSEAMFTSATGVGAGEFLIQSFDRAGKTALLVAGYNAADTEKAVTYLLNNDVDTTVGTKMKGTSATEATVVATA